MRAASAVLLLALSTAVATGCMDMVTAEEPVSMDEQWAGYERIVVRSKNGAIDLAHQADVVGMTIRGKRFCRGASLDQAERDLARIKIRAGADPKDSRVCIVEVIVPDDLANRSAGASLTIRIPSACPAEVTTSNGQITAAGLAGPTRLVSQNGRINAADIAGATEIRTTNGRIEATGIGGALVAQTSNGQITARTIAGTCNASSTNGRVEVSGSQGDVSVSTTNGAISVEDVGSAARSVRLASSNGAISAVIPASLKGTLDLTTSNGSITTTLTGMEVASEKRTRKSYWAQVNGGGDGGLSAKTSNASIRVTSR